MYVTDEINGNEKSRSRSHRWGGGVHLPAQVGEGWGWEHEQKIERINLRLGCPCILR